MSFLRRLFGRGEGAEHSGSESPRSDAPSSPAAFRKPFELPPPTPTLADLPANPHHAYFEFVGGSSSKSYAISLEEEEAGRWRVRFTFGRIGSTRAWQTRVDSAPWPKAAQVYESMVNERTGKGYEPRPWPPNLKLADGGAVDDDEASASGEADQVLFRAPKAGVLPPATGGSIADIPLPDGALYSAEPEGGSRGVEPVIWASTTPVPNVGQMWSRLATAFADTGIWPLIVDATYGFNGYGDYLMDVSRGRHKEALAILRKGWSESADHDDDYLDEVLSPFGKPFPGLAHPTPGPRPASLDHLVEGLPGHLAIACVHRPADVPDAIGWMGAVNYDADPLDMSTVLRSWELRFDAYLVGLGTDTMTLAVGRPAPDLAAAAAIAAEHYAFCPDIVDQGVGTIRAYASLLVNASIWSFWWD